MLKAIYRRHMSKSSRCERRIVIIVVRKLELIEATWRTKAIIRMTFWPSLLNWSYARIIHLILWRKGHLKCYRSPVLDLSALKIVSTKTIFVALPFENYPGLPRQTKGIWTKVNETEQRQVLQLI